MRFIPVFRTTSANAGGDRGSPGQQRSRADPAVERTRKSVESGSRRVPGPHRPSEQLVWRGHVGGISGHSPLAARAPRRSSERCRRLRYRFAADAVGYNGRIQFQAHRTPLLSLWEVAFWRRTANERRIRANGPKPSPACPHEASPRRCAGLVGWYLMCPPQTNEHAPLSQWGLLWRCTTEPPNANKPAMII